MIRPPRRAVTRFLIPFIDVLILLLCIFLLMPFVSRPDSVETASAIDVTATQQELQKELIRTQQQLETLTRHRRDSIENLHLCILEIDGKTGRLYAHTEDSSDRVEIQTANEARQVIERERRRSRGRAVGVIMRFPRELTGFPLRSQLEKYRNWFRNDPLALDIPGRLD